MKKFLLVLVEIGRIIGEGFIGALVSRYLAIASWIGRRAEIIPDPDREKEWYIILTEDLPPNFWEQKNQ